MMFTHTQTHTHTDVNLRTREEITRLIASGENMIGVVEKCGLEIM